MFNSGTLFLKKEEVIGTFTIHLAEYLVNTKRALLSKLRLLQEHLKYKKDGSSNELVRRVSIIVNRINLSLESYEKDATIKASSMNMANNNKADRLKRLGLLRRVIKNHILEERNASDAIGILRSAINQDKIETGQLNIKGSLVQSQDQKNSLLGVNQQSRVPARQEQSVLIGPNTLQLRQTAPTISQSIIDLMEKIIVFPVYKKDSKGNTNYFEEDLSRAPSKVEYVGMGYDSNLHGEHCHYRLAVDRCLEDTEFLSSQCFNPITIHTGKKIITEKRTWLQQVLLRDIPYREIGKFRGSFEIIEEDLLAEFEGLAISHDLELFHIPKSSSSWGSDPNDQIIVAEKIVTVRVYIVDAEIEEQVDLTSDPDAYLQLKLGEQLIDVNTVLTRIEIRE